MQDSTIEALISGMAAGLSGLSPLIEESTDTMSSVRSLLGDVSEKIIPVDVLSSVIPPSSDAVKSPNMPIPIQADVVNPKSRASVENDDLTEESLSTESTASGDTYITNNYYSTSSSTDNSIASSSTDNRISSNLTKTDISSKYVDRSDSASEITNNSLTRISSSNNNASSVTGDTVSLKTSTSSNEKMPTTEASDIIDRPNAQPQAPIRVEVVLPPTMQPSAASMNSYVDSSGNTVTYVSGSTSRIEGNSSISNSQSVINARSESATTSIDNSVSTQQDVYMPRGETVEKSYHSDRESRDSEIRELVKEIHIKSAESAPDMSGEIISAIRAMTETISSKLDQIVTYSRVQAKHHNEMIH